MDIKCVICGEPWDMECIHDEVAERSPDKPWYVEAEPEIKDTYTSFNPKLGMWYDHKIYEEYYKEVKDEFFAIGCNAFSSKHNKQAVDKTDASVYAMIAEIMGDDIDAIAAATEDYDYMKDMYDA